MTHLVDEYFKLRNANGEISLAPKVFFEEISSWQYYKLTCKGEYAKKDWYFGDMPKSEVEAELSNDAREGTYLIRNGNLSDYEISVLTKDKTVQHIEVLKSEDGLFKVGNNLKKTFSSIACIVNHFKSSPFYLDDTKNDQFYLRTPLGSDS